ncbi:hypothetical protein B0A55_05734 [Friedmanniomyces simplex]|uniref:Cobalamin-independent methionine synthase MetE C-terminal/archaeal domain-containing protein n=1 Tax=Friedmanniomyces simplex TaxID=329884 RepID=A0A4U0XBX2_9PEZI|nr:hypothetical protein B0A55_05734 [Friedmanniomyces simplex]
MPPPPFRADQIGSLIRPKYLIEARGELKAGITDGIFTSFDRSQRGQQAKDVERKAIAEALETQQGNGFTPLTSGEFERDAFWDGFFESLSGMQIRLVTWDACRTDLPPNRPMIKFGLKGRDACVATTKIQHTRSAYLDDWLLIRSLLPKERWSDVKMTLPSPTWYSMLLKEGRAYDAGVYDSEEGYLMDVASALHQEIVILYNAGLRMVQIDDPNLTNFCDQPFLDRCVEEEVDMDALLDLYIATHNRALHGLPSDLRIGIHMCRGNYPHGLFAASGGYEKIAAKLFQESNYSLFYLEYDTDRAGDFTPLKHLPAEKAVVLGLVTTRDAAKTEHVSDLKDQVLRAADIIAAGQGKTQREALDENLAVSPQCGFASGAENTGVGMTIERQWEKLQLLQDLARKLWPADVGKGARA